MARHQPSWFWGEVRTTVGKYAIQKGKNRAPLHEVLLKAHGYMFYVLPESQCRVPDCTILAIVIKPLKFRDVVGENSGGCKKQLYIACNKSVGCLLGYHCVC